MKGRERWVQDKGEHRNAHGRVTFVGSGTLSRSGRKGGTGEAHVCKGERAICAEHMAVKECRCIAERAIVFVRVNRDSSARVGGSVMVVRGSLES